MKHLTKTFLLLLALVLPMTAMAYDFVIDGVYYSTDLWGDYVSVSDQGEGGGLYSGNVNIPESVTNDGTTYPVTKIGYFAFKDCVELTGVNMPNTINEIGDHAFQNCGMLTEANIPAAVTYIGTGAFESTGLNSIEIPAGVTKIAMWAFQDCPALTDVYCHIEDPSAIEIGFNSFKLESEDYSNRTLHVPAGSIAAYKDSDLSEFFGKIVAL